MRRVMFTAFLFGISGLFSLAIGQESETANESTRPLVELPSDITVTPELWMYLHEYERERNPKEAIRRRAQFRAKQRRARLAAQRWYGHSPLRPTANSLPMFTNSHGSTWVGIPWSPLQWTPYTTEHRTYHGSNSDYALPALRMAKQRQ